MAADRKTSRDELLRVADLLSELVLCATDAEIHDAAQAANVDISAVAERSRQAYSRALTAVGKQRMRLAKSASMAARHVASVPNRLRDPASARAYVTKLIKELPATNDMRAKLTLAARSGTSMPDADIQSLLDDLARLGPLPSVDEE